MIKEYIMPISIEYDSNENVIYSIAEGDIRLDDIIAYFSSVAALNLQERYRVLADYSNALLDLNSEEIHEMARRREMICAVDDKIRVAVFCEKDLVFGQGRIYQALLDEDKYEVMIFRSQQESKDWLGL